MGDDQVGLLGDGLGDDGRGDGQAGHEPADGGGPVAEQQADVVPVGGEGRRGEPVEDGADGGDGRHGE